MKRLLMTITLLIFVVAVCAPHAYAKKKGKIRAVGGANITSAGIVIDASYDPRLDTLVPGYKVINVVLHNQSFNIIYLNPEKDKWSIKLAGGGKKSRTFNDLRQQDPKAWEAIPEGAKKLIGYPLVLPIGARQVFDLFVPDTVDVKSFNELHAYIDSFNTNFEIMITQ